MVQDRDGDLGTTSDQRVTETRHGPLGQIVSIASPEGTIRYEYDPVTRLRRRTYTGDPANPTSDIDTFRKARKWTKGAKGLKW